ncbi:MAG: aminotransferase class I/II-fold pyridoxal phosphate-dependent enzyme [Planctomycetota bacterium]|nr:MAG: aminotransferase class I/II-fold pyridoxal phosphate-dependent enzyme [Planctomycetota bacterium]
MSIGPSERIRHIQQSEIRNMTRECVRVGGINLGQGLGDLPTPPQVAQGAIEAIRAGHSQYSFPEGTAELREAIAAKLARDNGLEVDPAREIVVTVGSSGAFAAALMALLDPGDGLLLFEPYYGYHLGAALLAGLRPEFVSLSPPTFAVDESALRAAISPNTRAIVLCTPSNPSGKVMSADELCIIERVATDADLLVITDEIYEYIVYDGVRHISPATIGSLRERTVSIMGFSKTFSITGWRMGYAVAPPRLARAINMANDLFYVCAATPLQHGVTAGLQAPRESYAQLAGQYQRKRDIICAALREAGMTPIVPKGAYYVLAEIQHLGFTSAKAAAMALLEEVGVASIPGTAFYQGATGERLLRFCFAKQDDVLHEAGERIRRFRPRP